MKKMLIPGISLLSALMIVSCTTEPVYPTAEEAAESVIAKEREALDNWSAGHPGGYPVNMAEDASYMDDIGAHSRIDGIALIQEYAASLEGMVPPHEYEMQQVRVQVYGNVAVLSFRYVGSVDGRAAPPWKATTVYHYADGDWKCVHGNWSLVKEQAASEEAVAEPA